ncbi:MAG: PD40 domain-containing protein [Acidobacteria bacterium]|nr:PD40 domain-containing protein [Acidobacteriota bacterium]
MDEPADSSDPSSAQGSERGSRLDSWKEVAAYLNRDVRTVQRWEKMADLPVRRLQKSGLRAVFAYTKELDDWLQRQAGSPEIAEVAEVIPGATAETVMSQPGAEPPAAVATTTRWRLGMAGVAILMFLTAAIYLKSRAPADWGPLIARPITSDPGSERDPDISPDGKYVAYSYEAPNLSMRILVRLIEGSGNPRSITTAPANEWSPVWSPDGTKIAFLRGDPSGEVTLHLVAALGGEDRQVAAGIRPHARRRTQVVGHLLAWMPDGANVIVPDRTQPTQGSLFRINIETGERVQLTYPGEAQYDVEPSLSSDGGILLFNRIRGEYLSDVFIQKLDAQGRPDGRPRQLPPAGQWNGTPRLLEDRRELLVCAGSLPRLILWRQPLDGSGSPVSLGIIGDYAVQSAVHLRSGRMVSRTSRSQADILRYALRTKGAPSSAPVEPTLEGILESTFIDVNPVYSPDGSRIAFISDRKGRRQLWVSDQSGHNPTEWTQTFEVDAPPPAWSADGSKLLFTGEAPSGVSQLYVADQSTRTAVRISDNKLDHGRALFSHDGKYVYSGAADKSTYSIYRLPATPGAGPPEKVLSGYTNVCGVEPSGKGLYVTRPSARGQVELEFAPLPSGQVVHLATLNFANDAWVTPDGVYYLARRVDRPLAPVTLHFRTHAGSDKELQEYSRYPGRGLSISPDGRYAITTRVVPPISDLLLLETSRR